MVKIKTALISVSEKDNLESLAKGLSSFGVQIISTGGTARFISSLGIKVKNLEELTGFPEMLDGRVKTLHPKIHGGLLSLRTNPQHMEEMSRLGIEPIDMAVVNLYPFQKTVSGPGVKLEEAIENIDIGGVSIIRSAVKNYRFVAALTSPAQYQEILNELGSNNGALSEQTLRRLAVEAVRLTSEYESSIYSYLESELTASAKEGPRPEFPKKLSLIFDKIEDLRYGENPHQKAAFYRDPLAREISVSSAKQLHGKGLSYNNIIDMNAALEVVKEFDSPAACIIKHSNPCGVATAQTLARAYSDALECDRVSAFGGVIGLNRKVDINTAEAILSSGFIECIIAPEYEQSALQRLMIKQSLRLVSVEALKNFRDRQELDIKKVVGGLLIQNRDLQDLDRSQLKIVTQKKPTAEEVDALVFSWKVVRQVSSNAVVLAQGTRTVGIGAGQMSRVDSVFMALHKAGPRSKGAVLASEAFFPKEDAVELVARAGVTSIIQPGGSKMDEKIIALANQRNLSMVFTGIRHFRH